MQVEIVAAGLPDPPNIRQSLRPSLYAKRNGRWELTDKGRVLEAIAAFAQLGDRVGRLATWLLGTLPPYTRFSESVPLRGAFRLSALR